MVPRRHPRPTRRPTRRSARRPTRAGTAALVLGVLAGAGTACVPPTPGPPPPPPPPCAPGTLHAARDLAYTDIPDGVDPNLLHLDVYHPERDADCDPLPVVVWVHGGGWRRGDKTNEITDKALLAHRQGWILVSVNYRLSPAVQYPTHNDDVAAALGWVTEHIDAYGGDPDRLAVMGHSAGAGITSGVATNPRHLGTLEQALDTIDCAVSLDTEAYDVAARVAAGSDIYEQAFGTDPEVLADASPLTHVAPDRGIADFLVVVQGSPGRVALSRELTEALTGAGIGAELVVANPLSHGEVNAAVGDPTDTIVTPPLVDFLDRCL